MLLVIILFVILGFGIFFGWLGNKYDSVVSLIIGGSATLISALILISIFIFCLTLEDDFKYYESQYNNLKKQVEYVDHDDIVTSENLRNQVLEMNNRIDAHRIYHNNIFIGNFYSERIGNLEKLEWKSNK